MTNAPQITWPKAIFFDWDGTLVDSFDLIFEAHNFARTQLNMSLFDVETFRPYFGKPRDYLYEAIYGDKRVQAQSYFEQFVGERHMDFIRPIPGMEDCLNTLTKTNTPLGIISNKRGDFIRAELDFLGWSERFIFCIGSGETEADKPDPSLLLLGIRKTEIQAPSDIWYVGDTDIDLQAAISAGMPPLIISSKERAAFNVEGADKARFFKDAFEFHDFCVAIA